MVFEHPDANMRDRSIQYERAGAEFHRARKGTTGLRSKPALWRCGLSRHGPGANVDPR